jgi:hypothetical protein
MNKKRKVCLSCVIFVAIKLHPMKQNKSALLALGLLILTASLYRAWPDRPFGFAPQWALAVFGGAVIKDKRLAFIFPLLSMFISDTLYQLLFQNGASQIWGFYEGQLSNYILFGSLTVFGLMIRKISWIKIMAASLAAPSAYFLISNLLVWMSGAGYQRATLIEAYADGVPFYQMSLLATPVFSLVLFGTYFLVTNKSIVAKHQLA